MVAFYQVKDKLQQVMVHSDMKVSLTYLKGLEVKQLDVEDLPSCKWKITNEKAPPKWKGLTNFDVYDIILTHKHPKFYPPH